MAALVQTIPQQASTITLLHPRPASASSGALASSHPNHQQQHQQKQLHHQQLPQMAPRNHHHPRGSYGNNNNNVTGNRTPVAPYAFTSTPALNTPNNSQLARPAQLRADSRTSSAPSVPQGQAKYNYPGVIPTRGHHFAAGSVSHSSSSDSSVHSKRSKDDFALLSRPRPAEQRPRPLSTAEITLPPLSFTIPSSSSTSSTPPAKPAPCRYRRGQNQNKIPLPPVNKAAESSTSIFPSDKNHMTVPTLPNHYRGASADDIHFDKPQPTPELAKRYRRRSLGSLDTTGLANFAASEFSPSPHANAVLSTQNTPPEEVSAPRPGSSDSATSQKSNKSGHKHTPSATKRSTNPSPLSNRLSMSHEDTPKVAEKPKEAPKPISPAAKRLTEISKKGKGKSRLRRALSFSSVAELHKTDEREAEPKPLTREEQLNEELGAEQAAIAQQQEASGLGENIYSNIFAASTDNVSVSSTASSASLMLRKMGKGVKRSTRSLVGLFRPKSSHQTPEQAGVQLPTPQVSMVTVEAQRTPHEPADSGRAGPRDDPVGRNSDSSEQNDYASRKTILGGDRERAEILAAVRKGILKKTGCNSPTVRPADPSNGHTPHMHGSPHSSARSTPTDHSSRGHRRTDSVTIDGEDFLLPAGRFSTSNGNSAPVTPGCEKRNISFSPQLRFHDTWPPGEYDRRGEVSTCNKLTPLLAQQIKEELNTFKMEMEVHESSKIYTHFF